MSSGKTLQIIGAVVDVQFPRDQIPGIYEALKINDSGLTLEVQQQLGDGVVRTIAMGSSEGLKRGMAVIRHRRADLGAGRCQDPGPDHGRARGTRGRGRSHRRTGAHADPPPGADLRGAVRFGRDPRDRDQGHRSDHAHRQGRQGRPVRRRRRGQDRDPDGADPQHRHRAQRLLGVRRRRRAYP